MGEVLESNLVEMPKDVVIEIPVDVVETPKEKKPRKPKTEKAEKPITKTDKANIEKDVAMLLEITFGLVSTRAGEHWNITNTESTSIAKPLCNILEKYNLIDKAKNISDPVALVVAVSMVVAPRIMLTKSQTEKKLLTNMEVKKGVEQKRDSNEVSGKDSGNVKTEVTADNNDDIKSVLGAVQNGLG